jgi:hypothetical protein
MPQPMSKLVFLIIGHSQGMAREGALYTQYVLFGCSDVLTRSQ